MYRHIVFVEIIAPGESGEAALTEEFELDADQPLTFEQVWARVQLRMRRWLEQLAASPKFQRRFGSAPNVQVSDFGVFRVR